MPPGALRKFASLAIAALLASSALAQWKWTDADGSVTYSDRPPPPSIPSTRLRIQTPAPASSPAQDPGRPSSADLEHEFRQRQAEREAAQRQADARRQAAETQARACESARDRLRSLESGRRLVEIDGSGERRVVTEEMRDERIRTLREDLRERCSEAGSR